MEEGYTNVISPQTTSQTRTQINMEDGNCLMATNPKLRGKKHSVPATTCNKSPAESTFGRGISDPGQYRLFESNNYHISINLQGQAKFICKI